MKSERTKAKKDLRDIDASLLATARKSLNDMPQNEAPALAIGTLRDRIEKHVADYFAAIERSTLACYDNLVNKYGTTLTETSSGTRHFCRAPLEAPQEAGLWLSLATT